MSIKAYLGADVYTDVRNMLRDIVPSFRGEYVADNPVAIVVMDPQSPGETWFTIGIGEPEQRYVDNANLKIQAVIRTGHDSGNLDHLAIQGDFTYMGAVSRDGVVVGVSGWSQQEDEFLAEIVASFVKLQLRKILANWRETHPDERVLGESAKNTTNWIGAAT
jgi:hypothetical protein